MNWANQHRIGVFGSMRGTAIARVWARVGSLACVGLLTLAGLAGMAGCTDPLANPLPAETARVAIQSQCAQNVINCTTSWPTANFTVEAMTGQTVTLTNTGFLVEGTDGNGQETVRLIGSNSTPGDGAEFTLFRWTSGATDTDPQTLFPGTQFSTEADNEVLLATGFHYIRLRVENDIIRDEVQTEQFGVIAQDVPSFDFVELEVEVKD